MIDNRYSENFAPQPACKHALCTRLPVVFIIYSLLFLKDALKNMRRASIPFVSGTSLL
jgi:hypothetical protein